MYTKNCHTYSLDSVATFLKSQLKMMSIVYVCLGYGYGYVWVCMGMMGIFAKNCKTKTCKTTESHECSTFCEDECKKYVSEDVLKNL